MNTVKGISIAFFAALCLTLSAQAISPPDLQPGPVMGPLYVAQPPVDNLCGKQPAHAKANLIHVSCQDFSALSKYIGFALKRGFGTQVLIHLKGPAFAVHLTLDKGKPTEQRAYADVVYDPNNGGRWAALVSFDGLFTEFSELRTLGEVP